MSENLGSVYWNVDADTSGAITSEKALEAQTAKVESQLKSLDATASKTSSAVKKGIAGMGRSAGQAGIQFQQLIGQIQGGQSVMLALSQQSADLGFVLGAPLLGAVAGISASLVGILMPALFGSAEETKKLKEEITDLVKVSKLTEAQSAFLVSQTEDEIKAKQKLLEEAKKEVESREATLAAYNKLTEAQKKRQGGRANEKDFTKDLLEQRAAVDTLQSGIKKLEDKKQQYTLATKKSLDEQEGEKEAVEKVTTALEAYGKQLTHQVATLGLSDRGLAHYKAGLIGATEEMHNQIDAIYDHKQALADEKKTLNLTTLARKKAFAEMDKIKKAAYEEAETKQVELEARTEEKTVGQKFAQETLQEDPENNAIAKLQEEHAKLIELKAKFVEDSLLYDQALTANEKKQTDERLNYQTQSYAMAYSAMSTMFGSIASALEASGNEQSNAYKAMFAVSKGFAVASAGLHLSSAIVSALDDPTAITTAQKIANVATIASAGAGLVSSVTSAVYSGREHGGEVNAGQTYEVGEKNKPEMLMIPGNNGKVFSNAEMKGMMNGGGGNNQQPPIINNYGSAAGASVQYRQDPVSKQDIFDIVVDQMTNPNSLGRAGLGSTSNTTTVLNGRRRT